MQESYYLTLTLVAQVCAGPRISRARVADTPESGRYRCVAPATVTHGAARGGALFLIADASARGLVFSGDIDAQRD